MNVKKLLLLSALLISHSGVAFGEMEERATPVPDIQANGSNGPITINPGSSLNVTVGLNPGTLNGTTGDWWVYAQSPMGNYYYKYPDGWKAGMGVTHQGPLFSLAPFSVLNMSTLPNGSYTFRFRVDTNPNGQMETGYADSVAVKIGTSITNSLGMTFNLIPAGTFTMGSPTSEPGRESDETQHQVTLTNPFYMQTTEVTQGQWEAVMGHNPSEFSNCGKNCPLENINWNDAPGFITALNALDQGTYRLPTEAEWEYSARAGTQTAYSFGGSSSALANYAWFTFNSGHKTHPVAQKLPNPWGLFDMYGNVKEWVHDLYGPYPTGSVTNPTGPNSGSRWVLRGGEWGLGPDALRSAFRQSQSSGAYGGGLGLRLVRDYP